MRKSLTLVVVASFALSACGTIGGGRRGTPDEFAVARNAPLVIPPDYSLTPPVALRSFLRSLEMNTSMILGCGWSVARR